MRAWNQIAPLLEKYLQKERVSQILLLPLPCLSGLIHILICNTKIGEKSDMANPEQLFVAQVLINKVKSKCCGIKAP